MDTKGNNTKNNNFEASETFFAGINDFFYMKPGEEKDKKAIDLIQNIPNIENIKKIDKLLFYSNVSSLYSYVSKMKCRKYEFSDGKKFNINNILDDKNKDYLDEVLSDKVNAFNYCKNSIDRNLINDTLKIMCEVVKTMSKEEIAKRIQVQYENNKEEFRIISQDLCMLYRMINDEEKFKLYGNYAVEYNSLSAIYLFLNDYCDKMNYDNAHIYYDMLHTYPLDFYGDIMNNICLKIAGYKVYWEFLFKIGKYEGSLKVGEDCKKFILDHKLINKYLENIEEHIKNCKLKIQELNNNKYKDDNLLNYFSKDIIELMSDDNKIFILTSLNIYEYMKSKEITMDYSAALMPILKAIENIMFEIIGEKYHKFIIENEKKNHIDSKYIRAFINNDNNKIVEKLDKLELGKVQSLIGYKYKDYENNEITVANKYFKEFCNNNNVKNSKDVILKMYNELDKLRIKRNLVAHKSRVLEECVKECYDILLNDIRFINFLYTNFRFAFENNK